MFETLDRWKSPASILLAAIGIAFVLGCNQEATAVVSSRAMRIRLEVDDALEKMNQGVNPERILSRLVPQINIELEREPNGLGVYFDTCQQIRDGLIELEQLQGKELNAKVEQLRGLVNQLPEIQG